MESMNKKLKNLVTKVLQKEYPRLADLKHNQKMTGLIVNGILHDAKLMKQAKLWIEG